MLDTEQELDEKSQIKFNIQKLKQDPGYIYLMSFVNKWKEQCLLEILKPGDSAGQKGEFTAYGRVINLPDYILRTMEDQSEEINFDPYK